MRVRRGLNAAQQMPTAPYDSSMRIAKAQITFVNADGSEHAWSTNGETDSDALIEAIREFELEEAIAEAEDHD